MSEMLGIGDKKWVKKKYVKALIGTKLAYTIPDQPKSRYQRYVADSEGDCTGGAGVASFRESAPSRGVFEGEKR